MSANAKADSRPKITNSITIDFVIVPPRRTARPLAGCGKSLNRDDSPPQGLKPSLVLHDLRGVKAPLYHSAAGFRDFFRSLLGGFWVRFIISSAGNFRELLSLCVPKTEQAMDVPMLMDLQDSRQGTILFCFQNVRRRKEGTDRASAYSRTFIDLAF